MNPLVKSIKKIYASSDVKRVDDLLAEESRWRRKHTIASNRLAAVREDINALLKELAQPKGEEVK